MKVSLENLYHFSCDSCKNWWSIGDYVWGKQTHMWCPHCGHKQELPKEALTGDDFKPVYPEIGSVYQHRKHDPQSKKFHQYRVNLIIQAGKSPDPCYGRGIARFRHTTTGELHQPVGRRECHSRPPVLSEPHIAYTNTDVYNCDPEWIHCLRPLSEFMDGRFTLVEG